MTFTPVLNVIKADILFSSRVFSVSIHHQEFTRPVLRGQIRVYTQRNDFSTITTTEDVWTRWLPWQQGLGRGCCCVDGVHRKTRGANWQPLWDRGVFQRRGSGHLCSVEFHKKGQTALLLLAQSLREIHRRFVYSAQKEAAWERDVCLWFSP